MKGDVRELRQLFPVTEHWTYLYNGSIHACPTPVSQAMRTFLSEWENGGEAAFFPAFEAFGRLKARFAALIHASPDNIVVTESTTAAINLAAQIISPQSGQNIVVTDLAFMSNTYPWLVSHPSVEVRYVQNRQGRIHMEDLGALVDQHTAAISICAVTVGSGYRYDLVEVERLRGNTPLVVDAAQALGLVDIDINQPPLDFLATTTSKWLMGPTGVGFLYVCDRHLSARPPAAGWLAAANVADWDVRTCELHQTAMRFQGGIPNLVGVVGALAALELHEEIGRPFIEERVRQLTGYLLDELAEIGVAIWTPRADHERAGIVFFRTPEITTLHAKLKESRIYCGNFLEGIRVDPNFYNTQEELDRFLGVVREHVKSVRQSDG